MDLLPRGSAASLLSRAAKVPRAAAKQALLRAALAAKWFEGVLALRALEPQATCQALQPATLGTTHTTMKPKRQSPAFFGWITLGGILLLGCIAQCLAPAARGRKRDLSALSGGTQLASYPLPPQRHSSLITEEECHVEGPFAEARFGDGRWRNGGSRNRRSSRSAEEMVDLINEVHYARNWRTDAQAARGGPAGAVAEVHGYLRIAGQPRGGTRHHGFVNYLNRLMRDEEKIVKQAGHNLLNRLKKKPNPNIHKKPIPYEKADEKVQAETKARIARGHFCSPRWLSVRMRYHVRQIYNVAGFKAGRDWRRDFRHRNSYVLRFPSNGKSKTTAERKDSLLRWHQQLRAFITKERPEEGAAYSDMYGAFPLENRWNVDQVRSFVSSCDFATPLRDFRAQFRAGSAPICAQPREDVGA